MKAFDFQFAALFNEVNGFLGKPAVILLISRPFFYNLILGSPKHLFKIGPVVDGVFMSELLL